MRALRAAQRNAILAQPGEVGRHERINRSLCASSFLRAYSAAGVSLLSVVGAMAATSWGLIGSASQSQWRAVSLAAPPA